jgi:hypothetical protein
MTNQSLSAEAGTPHEQAASSAARASRTPSG